MICIDEELYIYIIQTRVEIIHEKIKEKVRILEFVNANIEPSMVLSPNVYN